MEHNKKTPSGPLKRQGPRPLALHLSTLNTTWMTSRAALPFLKNACENWNPSLKAEALALEQKISSHPLTEFTSAVDVLAFSRLHAFQAGVQAYRQHPYERDVIDPDSIWQDGNSRLLDYGGPSDGPVLLAVPSLINKAYILDLNKKRSFMRAMAKKGIRSFLLDWGDVGDIEKKMNLEDYILGRLQRCLNEVHQRTDRRVALLGYCMGGVLTTALSALRPEHISALVLLATPWDFHAGHTIHGNTITTNRLQFENIIQACGELPIDVLQTLFSAIEPYQIIRKFTQFGEMKQNSKAAHKFVALEDWLNDGVPLGGGLAKQCLFDWFVENQPHKQAWVLETSPVDPAKITCPTLLFIPENDRIVPPESALALGNILPNAEIRMISAGHIGMMTGKKALSSLYNPISKWLLSKDI